MVAIGFIPARFHSSRLPGKPLEKIAGKPLIEHVYQRASHAPSLNDLYVTTDDQRIAQAVARFGGKCIITGDADCGTARLALAATQIGAGGDDILVNIQGDQPLIAPQLIEQTLRPFVVEKAPSFAATTAAIRIRQPREITDSKDCKVVFDRTGNALYFSRAPIPYDGGEDHYFKHLGIYAYTKAFVDIFFHLPVGKLEVIERLEQLRILENGYAIRIVETEFDSPEVDVIEDIERVEQLLAA